MAAIGCLKSTHTHKTTNKAFNNQANEWAAATAMAKVRYEIANRITAAVAKRYDVKQLSRVFSWLFFFCYFSKLNKVIFSLS